MKQTGMINYDKLVNIVNMLQSSDKEDQTVALIALENMKIKENMLALLFAYKLGNPDQKMWSDNAPKAHAALEESRKISKSSSFQQIFKYVMEQKLPKEAMELFLKMFSDYLTGQCKSMGYNFIDGIEMKIKVKSP
jgi:hypothetical protein